MELTHYTLRIIIEFAYHAYSRILCFGNFLSKYSLKVKNFVWIAFAAVLRTRAFTDLCIACEFIEFAMKRNTVTSDILIEPERGTNSYTNNACKKRNTHVVCNQYASSYRRLLHTYRNGMISSLGNFKIIINKLLLWLWLKLSMKLSLQ